VEIFCLMLFRGGNCTNCKAPLSGHSAALSFFLANSVSFYLCGNQWPGVNWIMFAAQLATASATKL